MADSLHGRLAQRQAFMERLSEALVPLVGPRLSIEPHGGEGVAVLLDAGRGGTAFMRAAPFLPHLALGRDLTRTAQGVAAAVHEAAGHWAGSTSLGPGRPNVTRGHGSVRLQFFGLNGEPLPVVEVPLHPRH